MSTPKSTSIRGATLPTATDDALLTRLAKVARRYVVV